jgi:hypothetical protein
MSDLCQYYTTQANPSDRAVLGVGLGRLVAGIAGSNPARDINVCLCVYMLCCPVSVEALRRANRWFKLVIPHV